MDGKRFRQGGIRPTGVVRLTKTEFYLAPLRGITDKVFRTAYERHFGSFDYTVAPFIPTILGNRVKDHHIRDLLQPGISTGSMTGLIPQIIGRDPTGFLLLSQKFAEMGFSSVNWNLGCPAPLVAKKARGCGLLPHKDIINKFLDDVTPKLPIPLSIKARLGYESPNELEALIPMFNNYPIKELIIHPRIGIQLYEGTVDLDRFESCLKISKHTVVYNGDIISIDTFKKLKERFPSINKWMIGRGIIRNPFLLTELRGDVSTEHKNSQIIDFLNDILDACKDHPHPIKVLGRMKEIWRYLGNGIDGWGDLSMKIIQCKSLEEYKELIISQP